MEKDFKYSNSLELDLKVTKMLQWIFIALEPNYPECNGVPVVSYLTILLLFQ